MARLFNVRSGSFTGRWMVESCLALSLGLALPVWAETPTAKPSVTPAAAVSTNAPPATPGTPAKPGMPPATPPPPPPADFNRYGKIWVPSDDAAHPLKLNLPFPGVGEMKIPTQDELNMRVKLEELATLSDDDVRKKLSEWPPYGKMKLGDQGTMLMRIQQFKDQRSKVAMDQAHDLGLLTLTAEQKVRFEKEYWDKRLQMERDLLKQIEPIVKARDQKMREDLFREFSSSIASAPPSQPPSKPPQNPSPVAQGKPTPPATNAPPAVAQAPKPTTNAAPGSPIPAKTPIASGTPPVTQGVMH